MPYFVNEDGVTNNVESFTEIKENNINDSTGVKPGSHIIIYQQELIVNLSALAEPKLFSG